MKFIDERYVADADDFLRNHGISEPTPLEGVEGGLKGETEHAHLYFLPDKASWLAFRRSRGTIGASDAPTMVGLTDAWRTAHQLFDELRGETPDREDLSGNELVQMGNAEEPLVRRLFALENPQYDLYDGSNLLWISKERPWMSCTLDGIIIDRESGDIEDLEIKCAPWSAKWREEFLPDNYFVQLLWQMAVTGIATAHLKARLRFARGGDTCVTNATEKMYTIYLAEPAVQDQMAALVEKGEAFHRMLEQGVYFPMGIRI